MKKLCLLLTALLLTSCIDVEDFAAYWSKTTLDTTLSGHWKKIYPVSKNDKHEWVFSEKDGAYSVQLFDDGKPDPDGPMYPLKTLTAGRYVFLANGPHKGTMLRYTVTNNVINWYVLNASKAWPFIEKTFPQHENIYRDKTGNRAIKIKTFDDDVFRILSAIPDDNAFWHIDTKLEKVR